MTGARPPGEAEQPDNETNSSLAKGLHFVVVLPTFVLGQVRRTVARWIGGTGGGTGAG